MISIGQFNTTYAIAINGKDLADHQITFLSDKPEIGFIISESFGKKAMENLPKSIRELGSVMKLENADNLVKITSAGSYEVEKRAYAFEYGNSISYVVKDVKVGDTISFEIDPAVAKKMELSSNVIEVFYSREAR